MSAQKNRNKEQKQLAVAKAALEIIEKEGLLGLSHSKVSRKSGVSRAWIYEYIGKEKSALTQFAAEVFASHFSRAQLELPKNKTELQDNLKDGLHFIFDSAAQDPSIIKLYFQFRGTKNPIGQVIKKYEKQWLGLASKTANQILNLPEENSELLSELILILRMGFAHRLATSADVPKDRERAEKIFKLIDQFTDSEFSL